MADQKPDGWYEPVIEALWVRLQLFGTPPKSQAHWLAWFVASLLTHSPKWMWAGVVVQTLLMTLTKWDPEWPTLVRDLVRNPRELDP